MKLRGEEVAVLLADHRMPQMTGIEFLERAMDVYPKARRVLLTAYADTEAAIDAINVVDLDHYLLKPWDPPEEKLYPVLDDQIHAWKATDRSAPPEIKLIGHRYSARSAEVREFLTRNQVAFHWYLCDGDEARSLLTAAGVDEPAAARADHRERRRAGGAVGRADRRRRRPGDPPHAGLLRPRGHRRRARPAWAPPCTAHRRGCGPS